MPAAAADVPLDLLQGHVGTITAHRPASGGHMSDLLLFVDTETDQLFVKGQRNRPGGRLDSLKREAAINPFVRPLAPQLRRQFEDDEWYILIFEAVDGRHASFVPGSPDPPVVASALDRVAAIEPPDVATEWIETRWDRFTDAPEAFRGITLLYTDIHESNVLIGSEIHLVDWAWPTIGAGFIDPALMVIQLIAAGHAAHDAEHTVTPCRQWQLADRRALDAFCVANIHMWAEQRARNPAPWVAAMLDACETWARHRGIDP